jgi:hypothetical protein
MTSRSITAYALLLAFASFCGIAGRVGSPAPATAATSPTPIKEPQLNVERESTDSRSVKAGRTVEPPLERVPAGFQPQDAHIEGDALWVIVITRKPNPAEDAAEVAPRLLQLRDADTGRLRRSVRLPTENPNGRRLSDWGGSTLLSTGEGLFLLDPTSPRLIGRRVNNAEGFPVPTFDGLLAQTPGALWGVRISCEIGTCSSSPASLVRLDPATGGVLAEDGQISVASGPRAVGTPNGLWVADGINRLFRWPTGGAVVRVGGTRPTESLAYGGGRVWAAQRAAKGVALVAFDARTGLRRGAAIADPRPKASIDYPFAAAVGRRALWVLSQGDGALIRVPLSRASGAASPRSR